MDTLYAKCFKTIKKYYDNDQDATQLIFEVNMFKGDLLKSCQISRKICDDDCRFNVYIEDLKPLT